MKAILNKLILGLFRFLPCAFDATNMNRIQAGTTTLWMYKTTDAIATVAASGYFDDWYAQLNNGDTIIVADTNVPTIDMLTVTSASGATTVTTLNGT